MEKGEYCTINFSTAVKYKHYFLFNSMKILSDSSACLKQALTAVKYFNCSTLHLRFFYSNFAIKCLYIVFKN